MKYVDKLSDKELAEIFKLFLGDNEKIVSLEIIRDEDCISLNGIIQIPDDENGSMCEMLEVEDNYDLTDFNVKVYNHSGDVIDIYRHYMYKKFKSKYAKDYLFL